MKAGVTGYSLEAGISDVNSYLDAGTVVAALQSIADAAGQQSKAAANKEQEDSKEPQKLQ